MAVPRGDQTEAHDMNFSCSHNYALVALSVVIAMFASYAALDLAGRITAAGGWTRAVWLLGGAGAMGTGIWSMHYIGMLACMLPVRVAYHWPTVVLSLFAAILASAIALYVVSRQKMGAFRAFAGSVLMGGGIASMHYIGMAAMRLPAICQYNSLLVILSVVFAILISLVALWITFHLRDEKAATGWRKIAGAVVMGAAIPVMHYTGMAAAGFAPSGIPADLSHAISISTLGTAGIVAATLIVLGLALLTSWVDRRFAAQALELQEEKLHESEAYLSEAQRLSHTGSFGWRISSSEITWSEETFRIFQYDRTTKPTVELILQRVHPEDAALVKQTIERASQDGKDFDFEHRLLMRDGSVKRLHVVAHAERDKSGELEFVGALMDVTVAKEAREKLRKSEEKYRDLINASPDAICVIDADGKCVLVNPAGIKLAGRSEEELIGSSITDTYLPEDRHLFERRIEKLKAEGSLRFERKFLRKNGEVIPVEVSLSALRGRYYQSIIRDISQRKRREALLAGENRLLEMVAKGDSLADILDSLCLLVEDQSSGVLASILLMEPNGKRLRHGAAPSLPKAYTDAIDGLVIGPSVGSCGTAAYRAEQVIVSDIATDPLWADFRDLALAHSLRACWSTPIFSAEGKVIGTFAMYYCEPRNPRPREQDTIKHITHLAGVAIQRRLAEAALRESEAYLAEAQRLSHTGSWAWAPATGEIRYWSDETYRVLGFDPDAGPPRFETFFQRLCPEDQVRVRELFEDAIREKADFETDYRIVHPSGAIKNIHAVGHPVGDEAGHLVEFVGTVIDVTETKRSEEALRRSEAYLADAQRLTHTGSSAMNVATRENTHSSEENSRLFGFNSERATPSFEAFRERIHPEDRVRADEVLERSIREGKDFELVVRVVLPDGTLKYIHSVGHPVFDPSGDVVELIGTNMDVTERKRAEEALRASEQVARGQVEALAQSLDVLATAPDPEKFIGQMLTTIGRLLNAKSVSLWLFDDSSDSLILRSSTSDGGKLAAPDPEHPFVKNPFFWKENAVVQELLFTAGPVVCDDVETDPRVNGDWGEHLKRNGTKRFLAVPLLVGGQVRGFVGIRHADQASYRPEEIELTQALAHQVMLAIQLNEFAEQDQRAAVFEERNRMARDIHDTLAQGFTGVIVQLEAAEDAISCGCREEADDHLHRASELARRSLSEARRSVHALRPQALQEHNFWDALKGIIKNTTVGTALHTKFEAQGKLPELPQRWQENLLHIGQEALTNTLKYAHARNFETRLSYKARQLRLELRDDGDGFKVKDGHDGVGLTGMRERVEQMGGKLEITSSRGKGTKITVVLPSNGEST
jgi:PAS domain S-box-containing protein